MNVLYTWIGYSDLQAPKADKRRGPVADALLYLAEELDCAVLLFDHAAHEKEKADLRSAYIRWLTQQLAEAGKDVALNPTLVAKGDPTSFNWVYDAMRKAISDWESEKPVSRRHYLVGPGTTTMAACTLIVARLAACAGTLWQADEKSPQGCRRLELPFDLNLKDAPDPGSLDAGRAPGEQSAAQHTAMEPIVRSPSTQRAWQLAQMAAQSEWPVLLLGNTGTGKEELAKHIHRCSQVKKEPFIPINCGAIPQELIEAELFGYKKGAFTGATADQAGAFESAGKGYVFLDEVGELPLKAQTRFLRVLQERKVTRLGEHTERELNCRIIAATHRNLWQAVSEGRFRADLYYRLAGLIITLDDLANRPEDLHEMIDRFWQHTVADNPGLPGRVLSEGARQRLLAHAWPGNVRELKAALVRTAFLARSTHVTAADVECALAGLSEHLPPTETQATVAAQPRSSASLAPSGADLNFRANTRRYQRELVQQALSQAAGNKSLAARMLGISVQHLGRILKKR